MANYKTTFYFAFGGKLTVFPKDMPDDVQEYITQLCGSDKHATISPDGTAEIVFMDNVAFVGIEKQEE